MAIEKKKVVAMKYLPTRAPSLSTIVMWLFLDRLHAAQWIWGAVGVVYVVAWIAFIYANFWQEIDCNPFEKER